MALGMKSVFVGLVLVAFISQALGHSYLTNPISRSNQRSSTTGCRGPNCLGPCDRKLSAATRAPIVIARGASISVEWPRNNHAGGFIRLAWAKTADSDSHTAFDNGVQQINCHEVGGCRPDDASNPNGGDSNPADGSRLPCKVSITVPTHLTDGKWTLQWAWFGGAYALGDYYSCVDYTVSGGSSGSQAAPVFVGGDFSYPGQQKCKYFNTDRLHRCVNEPCDNPVYSSGQRSGAPFFSTATQAPSPVTQAPTRAPTPATQAPTPATQAPTRTPTPATQAPSTQAPSSGACTVGHMKCTGDSSYQQCAPSSSGSGYWVAAQSCQSGLYCSPNGNFIYCGRDKPSGSTPSTQSPSTQAPTQTPSSGSCTLGNQQCVGTGYQTCGHGRNGPAWSATQKCQSGLACNQRGSNIYCV